MPLREDLLAPIAGENPSGEDLYYDKVFDQIKEARREDDESLPEGDMVLAQKKKADHRAVIKLAGDALAKKSKDLRLAGWLVESQLRVEGFPVLAPGIELLRALQETFWPTLYPLIEEGEDLELRMLAVEARGGADRRCRAQSAAHPKRPELWRLFASLASSAMRRTQPRTQSMEARKDAIDHGKLSAEDFDQAFAASPKSLYVEAEAALGGIAPGNGASRSVPTGDLRRQRPQSGEAAGWAGGSSSIAESLLNERRKTEPDPVPVADEPAPEEGGQTEQAERMREPSGEPVVGAGLPPPGQLGGIADAYALVVESAEFLFEKDPKSPIPYLVCAGLRLGETRMQGPSPAPGFAVGPGCGDKAIAAGAGHEGSVEGIAARFAPDSGQRMRQGVARSASLHLARRAGDRSGGNLGRCGGNGEESSRRSA